MNPPLQADSSLHFTHPAWLIAGGFIVILMILAFRRSDLKKARALSLLVHTRFRDRLISGYSPQLLWLKRSLWLVGTSCLFVAAARPTKGYEWREVKRRGVDILFAVDTSRSMLAEDLVPNRLERAKLGITDFINQLEGDRVGLIPFAGTAFALCPLTLDYDAFRESLDSLNTELIPQPGTDLASAIREAEELFKKEGNNHHLLVLITDGEDLEGDCLEAAKKASTEGTTIYTVGVGGKEGQLIPIQDNYGQKDFLRDEKGNLVKTKLDETTLKQIADATGGMYVPLGRAAEGLNTIYQQKVSLVPKNEYDEKMEKTPLERFQWPLGAGILILITQLLIRSHKKEKPRKPLASAARRTVMKSAVVLLFFFMATSFLHAATGSSELYNKGTEAYRKGDFKAAADTLHQSLQTDDLSLQQKAYYNYGNSLFRQGQQKQQEAPSEVTPLWEQALQAYDHALKIDSSDPDAKYNHDLVEKKLKELKDQQNKDQQNKDQQNKDQQNKDQQNKDQQNKDQQNKDQQNKDQQNKDQQNKDQQNKDQQNKDQQNKDQQNKDQQNKDQQNKDQQGKDQQGKDQQGKDQQGKDQQGKDQQGKDQKDSKLKGQEDMKKDGADDKQGSQQMPGEAKEAAKDQKPQGTTAGSVRKVGEMSKEEALRLLQSLQDDERVIIPAPLSEENRQKQNRNESSQKTW